MRGCESGRRGGVGLKNVSSWLSSEISTSSKSMTGVGLGEIEDLRGMVISPKVLWRFALARVGRDASGAIVYAEDVNWSSSENPWCSSSFSI